MYSTDRLRVARGSMRDRRQFLDRQAAALWPSYRADLALVRAVLLQRNAALECAAPGRGGLDGELRGPGGAAAPSPGGLRRAADARARRGIPAARASATRSARGAGRGSEEEEREALAGEVAALLPRERAAGRSLAGPQRDEVELLVDGRDVAEGASSGQARSLLLALALASLQVYREETGRSAVALLDDLDSELDEERAGALCAEVARRGQALVTSAHPGWAESLRAAGEHLPRVGRRGALRVTRRSERRET